MQKGLVWILAIVLFTIAVSLSIDHERTKRHTHVQVSYTYGYGLKTSNQTFCLTDSTQVLLISGKHIKTKASEEYFNGTSN